ncbi:hypothetical protein D3C81_1863230 [compost metagenome]
MNAVNQLTQRLGFRFGTRMIPRQQHDIALFCTAIPAIDSFTCFPVCCREITIEINPVSIGAQAELTPVRVYRQYHVVTAQGRGKRTQGAG